MKDFLRGTAFFLILILTLPILLSACFAGAQDDKTLSGVRDGVQFCYLPARQTLLLSSSEPLRADNRIFSLPFVGDVRTVYLTKKTKDVDFSAFAALNQMNALLLEGDAGTYALPQNPQYAIASDVPSAETNAHAAYGEMLGHCLVASENCCILCGQALELTYSDHRCALLRDGKNVYDETLLLDGQSLRFDADGYLVYDGMLTLCGETRLYEQNAYVSGSRDIDGVRYTFSSDGAQTNTRPLDTSIPAWQIILPLCGLLLGAAICFGVYKFYRYKQKKEDEENA